MPQLADVVHISKRRESRKDRTVPWAEFEPYFNQLRTALDANQDDTCKYIGYGGGTVIATWRRDGVPTLAFNAIRWALYDLKQPAPAVKPTLQFTFDELGDLFDTVRGRALPDEARRALLKKLAVELTR